MGALFGGKCYSTNIDAADAFFLSSAPSHTAGSTSYRAWYEKAGGVWQIKRQSISSTGTVTNLASSNATVPTFPVCDENAAFSDGLTVGWLVVGLMILAWGLKKVREQVA